MIKVYIQTSHLKIVYSDANNDQINASETILKTKFCAKDSSMKMNPLVKKGIISDIRSFYNEEYNILPSGFWKYLQYYYDKTNIEYEVIDLRKFPAVDKDLIKKLMKDELEFGGHKPRDYQKNAIIEVIKEKGGVISLPTGSGKGFIIALLMKIYHKTNFIVLFNTIDLIEQTYRELLKYEFTDKDVGIIQGTNNDLSKRITLLSMQSYEKAFGLFPRIKGILLDEVHITGRTDTAEKVIYSCQNCSLKIGLSATPFNDNDFQTMRLYGNVGPIIYEEDIKQHIDKDYLSETNVEIYSYRCNPVMIKGNWQDKYDYVRVKSKEHEKALKKDGYEILIDDKDNKTAKKFLDYGDEYSHFVANDIRNALIVSIIKKYVAEGRRILVMFNRIEHGEIIHAMYPDAVLIHGQNELDERLSAEKHLVEKKGTVVIVSKIWSMGKNIPSADCLINASGGHSTPFVIQKLGRITRKSEDKVNAVVVDFDDSSVSIIGKRQSEKRVRTYQKKLGLPVTFINV